jgi:hypothetical protein
LALVSEQFLIFGLRDCLHAIWHFTVELKLKSMTLAFKCLFSEDGFGERTVPDFRFATSPS